MPHRQIPGSPRHHLLNLVAAGLVLVGLFITARGALGALNEIRGLYYGATEDPLAEPTTSEEDRSERMTSHIKRGVLGIVPLAAGSILFALNAAKRKKRRRSSLLYQAQPGHATHASDDG